MADARPQVLPLVTVGDPDAAEGHDWFLILSRWGLLQHDVSIARVVRTLGWLGMLGAVAWLAKQGGKVPGAAVLRIVLRECQKRFIIEKCEDGDATDS